MPGPAGHEPAVAAARERIHAGDLFQANVCLRMESELEGDPLDLFAAGVGALAPDRAAFVGGDDGVAVASLSPELFLERRGRRVRTAPIKGTRPRSDDPSELERSAKDRAENTMIVDLMRNDLGRVCEPGSRGRGRAGPGAAARRRLAPGVRDLGPAARGSGRRRPAARVLPAGLGDRGAQDRRPERDRRGGVDRPRGLHRRHRLRLPGGGPGAQRGHPHLRVRRRRDVWLGVGGGVVADSDPAAEARECAVKAAPLLAAIGARGEVRIAASETELAAAWSGEGPTPTPRPDPEAGVFSTLLVRDGLAIAAADHLARLGASVAELYGAALPADLAERIEAAAGAHPGPGRMRVTYVPGDAEPATIVVKPVRTGPPTRDAGAGHGPRRHRRPQMGRPLASSTR